MRRETIFSSLIRTASTTSSGVAIIEVITDFVQASISRTYHLVELFPLQGLYVPLAPTFARQTQEVISLGDEMQSASTASYELEFHMVQRSARIQTLREGYCSLAIRAISIRDSHSFSKGGRTTRPSDSRVEASMR